jgi:DNA-binding MarR family transcriptional regulator
MQPTDPFLSALHKWMEAFMHNSMRNLLLFSKDCGLSMPQIGALFRISHGKTGVSDLGDELGVTSAAASQMLERLVQLGLIDRSEDPEDRRAKQLILTDKGRQIVGESIQARQSWMNKLSEALSPAEKEQVTQSLEILAAKTEGLREAC